MKETVRRLLSLLLCLTVAVTLLAGCRGDEPLRETEPVPMETSATEQETSATEPETEEPTVETTQPTEEATQPAVEQTDAPEETEGFSAYLETVYLADLPIFSGPSYDDASAGIVEESGVYTIVEEAWDYEGNLWGRLKSGAGWINLTDSRLAKEAQVPVSAAFASQRLLSGGDYDVCIADESEYAVKIAIRFYENVTDVCISSLEFDGEEFVVSDTAGAFPKLTPERPLVMQLSFPGDMSCYGLFFTDSSGRTHRYTISISGRNGLVVLTEEASQ